MDQIKFLHEHCEFNSPTDCYVLIAISRKKDTPEMTSCKEIVFRDVIKCKEDIEKKYLKIKASIQNYRSVEGKSYPFYLYISLNARDGRKATIELMKRITSWIEQEPRNKDISEKYKRTYAEFYSCLALPTCRGSTKYFMIDIDSKIDGITIDILDKIGKDKFQSIQDTRHGYHMKTLPFDRRLLPNQQIYAVHTDGLFFVEYIKNDQTI